MRSLLALLAIVMFVGAIGCSPAEDNGGDSNSTTTTETENKNKDESASATSTGEYQEVALKLPAMT